MTPVDFLQQAREIGLGDAAELVVGDDRGIEADRVPGKDEEVTKARTELGFITAAGAHQDCRLRVAGEDLPDVGLTCSGLAVDLGARLDDPGSGLQGD